MAKRQPLRAVSYIKIDGRDILWEDLTPELRAEHSRRLLDNAGRAASEYLSQHPDEAMKFIEASKKQGDVII